MLDGNLPTFYLKENREAPKADVTVLLSRQDSEPEPVYTLRHADPSTSAAKHCYAAALLDCWNPDVLFGEVAVLPDWSQPAASQETIRQNGGVPPPPEPLLPLEFVIQLYNPDQQVRVSFKSASLLSTSQWTFSMPQRSFPAPSGSALDRSHNDVAIATTTAQLNFAWKRESKLSKDLGCAVTGKSTDVAGRKKHKEPDITIALFKSLKEMTIYEPNLYRVEMEDPKGLEVVLLLGAAAIRDVYFGNMRQAFNFSSPSTSSPTATTAVLTKTNSSPTNATGGRRTSGPPGPNAGVAGLYSQPGLSTSPTSFSPTAPPQPPRPGPSQKTSLPITDPGTQWEIDRETARLKAHAEREERELRKREEALRRQREKEAEAESKRVRRMVEEEERERRRKQAEVDKETQRLLRLHGPQAAMMPTQRPAPQPSPSPYQAWALAPNASGVEPRPHTAQGFYPQRMNPQPAPAPAPYVGAPMMSGGLNNTGPAPAQHGRRRRSIWGLRDAST